MIIEFKHLKPVQFKTADKTTDVYWPTDQDVVYHNMIMALKFDDFLSDFFNENDTVSTTCNEDEYEGNVVVFYKRAEHKEKRALFCFNRDSGLSGKEFYSIMLQRIKDVYSEELI